MVNIVAISGSHGSGKTTLCYGLAAQLKKFNYNIGLVTESSRSSHYLIAGDKSIQMHLEILCNHVVRELQAARLYPLILCDRSVFDFLAYARVRFPTMHEKKNNYVYNTLESVCREFRTHYAQVLLTAGSFGNPEGDIVRSTELVPPKEFDLTLRGVLSDFSVPFEEIPREQALEFAFRRIRDVSK